MEATRGHLSREEACSPVPRCVLTDLAPSPPQDVRATQRNADGSADDEAKRSEVGGAGRRTDHTHACRSMCSPEYSVNDKLREIDVANEVSGGEGESTTAPPNRLQSHLRCVVAAVFSPFQNVHGSVDYTGKVSFFKCSAAYRKIVSFLTALNTAVKGKTMTQLTGRAVAAPQPDTKRVQIFASDAAAAADAPAKSKPEESKQQASDSSTGNAVSDAETTPSTILALMTMLSEVEELIAQCPPSGRGTAAPSVPLALSGSSASNVAVAAPAAPAAAPMAPGSRFGSPAFRDFLTLLTERAPGIITRVLAAVPADTPAHAQLQRTISEIDAPQSAESLAWEKQGFETLAEFKRKNDAAKAGAGGHAHGAGAGAAHGHAHGHPHVHKLPPGVVISHGASGIGNPPRDAAAAESKHEHDHEHEHEHGASCASSSSAAAPAAPADSSYDAKHARLVHHLTRYLVACWGDIRRLDYVRTHGTQRVLCVQYLCSDAHPRSLSLPMFSFVSLHRALVTSFIFCACCQLWVTVVCSM